MSMLTNFIIADLEEVDAICESSSPTQEWRGVELRNFVPAKIATLDSMLTGEFFGDTLSQYESLYSASDDGPWIVALSQPLIEKLALLDEEAVEQVGEELAASEEFEREEWPVDEVQAALAEIASLASITIAQEKALFVWMMPDR
ncbi:MAG: hypothetical protein V4568_19055 [Pseudomonadota bacterium]